MRLYQRLFACGLAQADARQQAVYGARKRQLFSGLAGTVLEIGPGTGLNLPLMPPAVEQWAGAEPNPYLHDDIRAYGRECPFPVQVEAWSAADVPLPDASVDAVISTLVLCSVPDVAAVLREVRRVLRPGGRFAFVEHVAAPPGTGLWHVQRWIKPVWRPLADGCRPDRETLADIEAAGFARVEVEHFRADLPFTPIRPHVAGLAVEGSSREVGSGGSASES